MGDLNPKPLGLADPNRGFLNRRAFIVLLAGTAIGFNLLNSRAQTVAWESIIRSGFPLDDGSIHQLGASCSEVLDDCATLPELVRRLRPCAGITWVAAGASSAIGKRKVLERLARLVADEYAAGQTIIAEGWVLSHTEAAFCAAATLRARTARA